MCMLHLLPHLYCRRGRGIVVVLYAMTPAVQLLQHFKVFGIVVAWIDIRMAVSGVASIAPSRGGKVWYSAM